MTAAVTALDWYRHHVTGTARATLPRTPVGPDLAVGLSQDFGQDAFDALDWEVALEVDLILSHGSRGSLPTRSTIELGGENAARADIAAWPNVSDRHGA